MGHTVLLSTKKIHSEAQNHEALSPIIINGSKSHLPDPELVVVMIKVFTFLS